MRSGAVRALVVILVGCLCLPLLTGGATAQSAATAQAQMWDVVDAPGWSLMVRSVERLRDPLPGVDHGTVVRPAGQFAVLVVDLTNRTSRPQMPPTADFLLSSANGGRWVDLAETPAARAYARTNGFTPFGEVIPAGKTVRTIALFDINFHASRLTLHWRPSGERSIRIDECHCNLPIPSQFSSSG
ncbi:MAG TPA: hypothetical protein VFL82_13475 [Thermomicrobiales bacterium]|nr:hypothetical protein [Thermomicrobiales bacterium]